MKIYGIYTIIIGVFLYAIIFTLLSYPINWYSQRTLIMVPAFLIYGTLLFKIVIIKDRVLKVYSLLSFFKKKNTLRIDEISKVIVAKNAVQSGGWADVDVYNHENRVVINFKAQMYNFEIKRLARQLEKENVKVSLDGTAFWDI